MTGRELYKAVSALGYQTSLEFDDNFYTAANIALLSVSRLAHDKRSLTVGFEGKGKRYDMMMLVDDFDTFPTSPIKELVKGVDYKTEGLSGIVFLSDECADTVTIEYKHRPRAVNPDNMDDELDISVSLSDLLILLTAFYVLLDDDPDKAMVYFTRYSEGAEKVIRNTRDTSYEKVINVTGW